MNVPIDDEPVTPEVRRLIDEAKEEVARGEVVSWEEAQRLLLDERRVDELATRFLPPINSGFA